MLEGKAGCTNSQCQAPMHPSVGKWDAVAAPGSQRLWNMLMGMLSWNEPSVMTGSLFTGWPWSYSTVVTSWQDQDGYNSICSMNCWHNGVKTRANCHYSIPLSANRGPCQCIKEPYTYMWCQCSTDNHMDPPICADAHQGEVLQHAPVAAVWHANSGVM